jgi:hypothetical protein
MLLVGGGVWAYVIGSICGIISTLNPAKVEFRQTMDQLNYFVGDQGVPDDLAIRLRGFFRNSQHLIRSWRNDSLLSKLSKSLWGETSHFVAKRSLSQVAYLCDPDLEPDFLLAVAVKFSMMVYSRLEPIPVRNLTVVRRGVCAKNGRVMLAGAALGTDVVMTNLRLRDLQDAVALTFVQVQVLRAEDMGYILESFPVAAKVCRVFAFKQALRRAVVRAAEAISKHPKFIDGEPAPPLDLSLNQAIDRYVHEAPVPDGLANPQMMISVLHEQQAQRANRDSDSGFDSGGKRINPTLTGATAEAQVSESRLVALEAKLGVKVDQRADALAEQLATLAEQVRRTDQRLEQLLLFATAQQWPKRRKSTLKLFPLKPDDSPSRSARGEPWAQHLAEAAAADYVAMMQQHDFEYRQVEC